MFEIQLGGAPYQVVTRLMYADPYHEQVAGGLGFLVNLDWARRTYFPEIARQVARISAADKDLLLSVIDEHGRYIVGGPPPQRRIVSRRTLPLLFIDPLLVVADRAADLPRTEMVIEVQEDYPFVRPLGVPPGSAARPLLGTAVAAGVLALGLALTAAASRASARLAETRSDFVASMTHELKTPLATIRAVGDSVASGRVTGTAMLREYGDMIVHESRRLTRLVDNALALARITDVADVYHFGAIDARSVVEDALRAFGSQLSAKAFIVDRQFDDPLPYVMADRSALDLALDNLIDNALRYSGDGRWLGVRVWCQDGTVRIAIRDKGIGIPDDEVGQVVSKFFRGRRATPGGSGLGLTIVNRIIDAHRGRMTIESAPGTGTTVTIELLQAPDQSAALAVAAGNQRSSSRSR